MSESSRVVRLNAQAGVTVRQSPTQLMMKLPLQATGATLELGLTSLRKQVAGAERWLQSLGASTILQGEPHFANAISQDPLKQAREMAARAMGRPSSVRQDPVRSKTVEQFLTAFWDIAGKSAEERLVLLDRLQFEAASDTPATEAAPLPPDPESFSDPMQLQAMLSQMMEPKEEPRQAQLLFITKLSEAQARLAYEQAYALAMTKVKVLADTADLSSGRLESVSYGYGNDNITTSRHMEQQACQNILAGTGYQLGEHETASEEPVPAEFRLTISVHLIHDVVEGK